MGNDNFGYYSDLGVSQTASLDEIRAVYRALAKIYHPDINKDKAATEKFRRITAAYEVLSDSGRRIAYDANNRPAQSVPTPAKNSAADEQEVPVVQCSVCKKPTAQPRYLIFRHVVSFIIRTWITPKAGVYCHRCAAKQSVRSTLISAAFGWWGIPWGPVFTVINGLKNSFGGETNREINEQLMWQNAVAFGRKGNFELSGALASRLTNTKDKKISDAAKKLLSAIQADGYKIKPLKSPWRYDLGETLIQIVSLCIVPVGVVLAYSASPTQKPSNFVSPPTASDKDVAQKLSQAPVNLCNRMPINGQLLLDNVELARDGHKVTIRNGSNGNAIVKLRDQLGKHTLVSFFVSKNQAASIVGIPDGTYKIQFATGDAMLSNCGGFILPNASEFGGTETFHTTNTSTQIISQSLELTPYTVAGGNAVTNYIDASAFQND